MSLYCTTMEVSGVSSFRAIWDYLYLLCLLLLENPLFRETAVLKQKFVRKIFMIISVVCDLKMMPDAKNYIPCLDWWALSWFLCGHLKVLCRL